MLLQADAALMCSSNEAMGRVTAEAMSACLPVIGYDHAGTAELIEHETHGLLYRGGPAELAAAMRRLVERRDLAREWGLAGWKLARGSFSTERYASRIHTVLRSVA